MINEEWLDARKRLYELIENVLFPLESSGWTPNQPLEWVKMTYATSHSKREDFPYLELKKGNQFLNISILKKPSKSHYEINLKWEIDGLADSCFFLESDSPNLPSKPNTIIEVLGKIRWKDSDYTIDGINPNIPEVLKLNGSIKAAADWYFKWGYQYTENETLCQGADNIKYYIISQIILHLMPESLDSNALDIRKYLVDELGDNLYCYDKVKPFASLKGKEITVDDHKKLVRILWDDLKNYYLETLKEHKSIQPFIMYLNSFLEDEEWGGIIERSRLEEEFPGVFDMLTSSDCTGYMIWKDYLIMPNKLEEPSKIHFDDRQRLTDILDKMDSTSEVCHHLLKKIDDYKEKNVSKCEKKFYSEFQSNYKTLREKEIAIIENEKDKNMWLSGVPLIIGLIMGAFIGYVTGTTPMDIIYGSLTMGLILGISTFFIYQQFPTLWYFAEGINIALVVSLNIFAVLLVITSNQEWENINGAMMLYYCSLPASLIILFSNHKLKQSDIPFVRKPLMFELPTIGAIALLDSPLIGGQIHETMTNPESFYIKFGIIVIIILYSLLLKRRMKKTNSRIEKEYGYITTIMVEICKEWAHENDTYIKIIQVNDIKVPIFKTLIKMGFTHDKKSSKGQERIVYRTIDNKTYCVKLMEGI